MATILVLGGTAWLGREIVKAALARGHNVTCAARGTAGHVPDGVTWVRVDRDAQPPSAGAFDLLAQTPWDLVVDVTRQPGHARRAAAALAANARHWAFVSSLSVYADTATPQQDEAASTVEPYVGDIADASAYAGAKRACELAFLEALPAQRVLIARAGLIGGPGDHTGRTGYWPLRFAQPADDDREVLVPDEPNLPTQVIDVRDLAAWLVTAGIARTSGIFNACGDVVALRDHLDAARAAAAAVVPRAGTPVLAGPRWLEAQDVTHWAGPRSLPLWLPRPAYDGFGAHRNAAAKAAGLELRPLRDTLADTLEWQRAQPPDAPRMAGLSADDERALLQRLKTNT